MSPDTLNEARERSYHYSFPEAFRYDAYRPEEDELDDALDYVCNEFEGIDRSNWLHQTEFLCERVVDLQWRESKRRVQIKWVRQLVVEAIFQRPRP